MNREAMKEYRRILYMAISESLFTLSVSRRDRHDYGYTARTPVAIALLPRFSLERQLMRDAMALFIITTQVVEVDIGGVPGLVVRADCPRRPMFKGINDVIKSKKFNESFDHMDRMVREEVTKLYGDNADAWLETRRIQLGTAKP